MLSEDRAKVTMLNISQPRQQFIGTNKIDIRVCDPERCGFHDREATTNCYDVNQR